MRITIERASLLKALNHVQSVVERRNTIPILSNVLLNAEKGKLSLTATDLDIEVVESVPADVVKGGGRVIAGTDSPINPYGVALLSEIEHYVLGGVAPADAIRTATAVPAQGTHLRGEEPGQGAGTPTAATARPKLRVTAMKLRSGRNVKPRR